MIKKLILALILLAPATAFAQQYAPTYQPPPTKQGLTFEANIGFGMLRVASDSGDSDSENALGGLDLGIGTFMNPNMAISFRIAGVTYVDDGGQITQAFAGPSLQYWAGPNIWFGGGLGLGVVRVTVDGFGSDSETKLGLDLRAGYTFNPTSKHSWNVSAEVTPTFFDEGTITGIAFLLGYQTL